MDGLRGLAACVVALLFHARLLYGDVPNPFEGVPVIGWFQVYGWAFVDLFFVLSGVVFAQTYLDGWQLRRGTTAGQFVLARIARLWPLHLAVLAFTVLLLRTDPDTTPGNVTLAALMLQAAIQNPTEVLNGPAWSLSVEIFAYAVFLAAALARPALFKAVAVAAILYGAIAVAANGVWGALLGRGLMGFFVGVLVLRNHDILRRTPVWLLVPVALIPAFLPPDGAWLIATTLLAWPALIVLSLRQAWLAASAMVWLGGRSYAVYLLHVPVYTLLGNLGMQAGASSTAGWLAITGAAWLLILLLANIAYLRLERPAQAAIRSWAERASPALA